MPQHVYEDCVALLQSLIRIPSFSKEEDGTAGVLEDFLQTRGVSVHRYLNNVWASNRHFDPAKPTLLLNSHHDTVKPNPQYTRDPLDPGTDSATGRLYGLGSNDAGGCLVALLGAFLHFYEGRELKYNLLLAATAEEEISGRNGVKRSYPCLPAGQLPPSWGSPRG